MRFSKLVTTAFSRGYTLTPLRGCSAQSDFLRVFIFRAGSGVLTIFRRSAAETLIQKNALLTATPRCASLWPFLFVHSGKLAADPFQFAAHVVNDIAGLQARGQDVPGVRFN